MSLDTSQLECFDGLPPLYKQGAITHRTCVRNAVVAPVIDRPWPLLGREREFAALGDVLRAARGGIVVEGNAGVGKTGRLRDFAARAACRFVAATVSARPYPFGVFGELLPSNIGDAAERRRCVIDVVTAGRGVLVIDDAHLLDEDSAQVVDDIVRGERPAVVVLGIRTGETMPRRSQAWSATTPWTCCASSPSPRRPPRRWSSTLSAGTSSDRPQTGSGLAAREIRCT